MQERKLVFDALDSSLYKLSDLLNISYEEACVYVNIWFTDIGALLVGVLPIVLILYKKVNKLWLIPFLIWLWVITCFYVPEIIHYSDMTVMEQFNAGVQNCLAINTQEYYEKTTLFRYVVQPLVLTCIPLLASILLLFRAKPHTQTR